jgi:EmrB/QacA subfamily drug resistance transporter
MDRKWWTLTAVSAGVFMLLLDVTIVNVALPDIQSAFGASLSDLQWVIDAYALTLAALLLTAGSLADLLGRRRLFALGIVVFTAGSLLCGLSTSATFLALARAFQGVGAAIMFATALALIAHAFRGRDRGTAFGIFGAITGIAVAVGPVLGGVITSGLSWRWIFFVNIPLGIAATAVTLLKIDESRDTGAHRPDWIGFVTFSGALAALVYGLIRANAEGWGSPLIVGCFVAAAALLGAFVIAELVQRSPMLDMSLLRKPTFVGGLAAAFAISASLFAMLTYLVLYFQNVLGYSAAGTGVRFLALTGAIFLTAGVAGRLSARVPTRLLIGPGFLLIGVGLLLMRGLDPASDWTHLLPGLILSGVGAGLVNVPLASTAVGVVEPARAGMASGINATFRQVGVATGIAALGAIFAARIRDGVETALTGTPLGGSAHGIAEQVSTGHTTQAIASAPAPLRGAVAEASRAAFVSSLNDILLVGAVVALVAAVAALALIRQRDFVDAPALAGAEPEAAPARGAPARAAA